MTVIAIRSGLFCNGDAVTRDFVDSTGYRLITDNRVVVKAAALSGLSEEKIRRSFTSKTSVFNEFTHEKELSVAGLRLALANELDKGPAVVNGFTSLLVPRTIGHLLRVCITAEMAFRMQRAHTERSLPPEDAIKQVRSRDNDYSAWTRLLFSVNDPWANTLYDMVLPMDQLGVSGAVAMIEEKVRKETLRPTTTSIQAQKDYLLAATVKMTLCKAGHDVTVDAENGFVSLTINKQVLMLSRLESELVSITSAIPEVRSVTTQVGKGIPSEPIYRKRTAKVPSRVLLVDDEREFVQTLSERLQLRDMGSAVAFDGESALHLVNEDEPEVMILDLRMPGIDGMEILRRVKSTRPAIEVIVLTGHGNEKDREQCLQLGAFAYMQKPVDIDQLSETLKKAHAKTRHAQT